MQVSCSNQYVVDYTIHPNPTDTTTLIPHLARIKEDLGVLAEVLTADAGCGSEENYEYLQAAGIASYVKYGHFNKDRGSPKVGIEVELLALAQNLRKKAA